MISAKRIVSLSDVLRDNTRSYAPVQRIGITNKVIELKI
jgi:hypothetical protein